MKILVKVYNTQFKKIDTSAIETLAKRVWNREGKDNGKIEIILVNNDYISKLNKKFLNKNRETDVMAFPLYDDKNNLFEGEIYISIDKVEEQAKIFNVNPTEELHRMVIHGILHFLGYKDNTPREKQKMINRENFYLGLSFKESN